jgi:ribonuclease BN (tRNA processing enzyme)
MDGMQLRFLGSGDAFGSGGRFQTCLYLQQEDQNLLIDCGASSLSAMKRVGLDPSDIGCALISHLHGDHFGGLPFLILDGQFSKRTRPLVIAGPPGVRDRLMAAMEVFFPGSSSVTRRFPLEFIELSEYAPTPVGSWSATAFPVRHPSGAPSFALRVQFGAKILSYSGDTEWADTLVAVAEGADLFICEAYSFEKDIRYHLSYKTLLARRDKLRCKRLVMTHMHQDLLDRLSEVTIEYANDGQVIQF